MYTVIQILKKHFHKKMQFSKLFLSMGLKKHMANTSIQKLQIQLCELKLQERHVRSDIHSLVKKNATIDFYQAQKLHALKNGIQKKIEVIENNLIPNIIA